MKKILILIMITVLASCGGSKKPDVVYVDSAHTTVPIENLQWDKEKFPLRIVVPSSFEEPYSLAIQAAANSWNVAMNRDVFEIIYDGLNLVYPKEKDYVNDQLCYNSKCGNLYSFVLHPNWFSEMTNGASILAVTSYSYDRSTARMIHADILFNNKNYNFEVPQGSTWSKPTSMDLQSVLAHELGHFLGLKHVCKTESQRKNIGTCDKSSTIFSYDACRQVGGNWKPECIGAIDDPSTLDSGSIMNTSLGYHEKKRDVSVKDVYNINKLYKNKCTVSNSLISKAITVEGNLPDCEVTACENGYTPSADRLSCE